MVAYVCGAQEPFALRAELDGDAGERICRCGGGVFCHFFFSTSRLGLDWIFAVDG